MGKIILRDITTYSYHGCFSEERKIGSEYKLDIWVEADFSRAEKTDQLKHTIDYVAIVDIATREMAISSKLLEHVGNRILSSILEKWKHIKAAGLKIKKITPPTNQYVESVVYETEIIR